MSSPDATPPPALYTTLVFDPKTPPIAATEMTFPTMDTEVITPTADTGMTLPTMDTEVITPTADTGMTLPTMDIAIVAAVIAAVALVLLCLLLVMLRYLFRHKGTYHTNEAKGTEFAESADVALQSDPALQDAGDSGKKEYFI